MRRRTTRVAWLVLLLAAWLAAPARAALRLPAVISNHMVLQQGVAAIWGWAEPGRRISVSIAGRHATSTADHDGRWEVEMRALPPGGPHRLTISGDGTVIVSDVLIGEVWLAAGQSNMQIPVRATDGASTPIPPDDCAQIRLFVVERVAAPRPLGDARGAWLPCTAAETRDFPSIPFFFALDLAHDLSVPVGMVVSTWGSTAIPVWLPPAGSDERSSGLPTDSRRDAIGHDFALELSELRLLPDAGRTSAGTPLRIRLDHDERAQRGLGGRWHASAQTGSEATYRSAAAPHGPATFSGTLRNADAWASASTSLGAQGEAVDLGGHTALAWRARGNGVFRPIFLQPTITDGDPYAGEAFRVTPEWQTFETSLHRLHQGGWGAVRPLTLNAIQAVGFTTSTPTPTDPAVVYNAMIHPLAPFQMRGIAWYQGESDTWNAADYGDRLRRLVQGWRARLGTSLPFLIVQLPGFGAAGEGTGESRWAEVREAQRAILALDRTALVTTLDLGDPDDIHPRRKRAVGTRLASAAMRLAYGTSKLGLGPFPEAAARAPTGHVTITFAEADAGLASSGASALRGFTVSADGVGFEPATARIAGPRTVSVTSDSVSLPVEVRYAWADNPASDLVDAEGLPATPFRLRLADARAEVPLPGRSSPGASTPPLDSR